MLSRTVWKIFFRTLQDAASQQHAAFSMEASSDKIEHTKEQLDEKLSKYFSA